MTLFHSSCVPASNLGWAVHGDTDKLQCHWIATINVSPNAHAGKHALIYSRQAVMKNVLICYKNAFTLIALVTAHGPGGPWL
jgi:hypothetical protein